jgi:peptidoglycan/xylan/chitin deacetylase (PgdA/CDA1 family)
VPAARVVFWVATFGALGLLGRSIAIGPVPIWMAGAAMGGYLSIILAGVFFLRLRMFVDAVCHGGGEARGVALTFDDGPHPDHTPRVLDLLAERGAKATFFVVGRKAEAHPAIVRRMHEEGHELGIHSWRHDRFLTLRTPRHVKEDLVKCLDAIERITGERPGLFRPPVGHTSPRVAQAVRELDLEVVGWSVKGMDGLRGAEPAKVARRITGGLEDGAIVLLHDAAERDDFTPASLEALPAVLDAIEARNLACVAVSEFLDSN